MLRRLKMLREYFETKVVHSKSKYNLAVNSTSVKTRKCQILLNRHVKLLQKKTFFEKAWPANSALFVNVFKQNVETFKLSSHCPGFGYRADRDYNRSDAGKHRIESG